jgi:hypothetical protein
MAGLLRGQDLSGVFERSSLANLSARMQQQMARIMIQVMDLKMAASKETSEQNNSNY